MTHKCGFNQAWVGSCQEETGAEGERCEEHQDLVCRGCGLPAVRSCDHTGIQFVCGAPLCGNCAHTPPNEEDPNWFGLGGGHAPKEIAAKKWEASWG